VKKIKSILIISLLFLTSCEKELLITEFSQDFSNYTPELRIEAIILPTKNTALVRIDRSVLITDMSMYDCIDNDYGKISDEECEALGGYWHGTPDSTIANCGDWNPLIHDIGIDGKIGDPNDENENCGDCSFNDDACQESCREEDSIGENNGIPDCGEPNVDNYSEFLPDIHQNDCTVSMTKITFDGNSPNSPETCNFTFEADAGEFFDSRYTGSGGDNTVDDFITVNYGAYVPDENCSTEMFTYVYVDETINTKPEYTFIADCTESGFGIVSSHKPINISDPVVFVDTIQNNPAQNPESQDDIDEYLDELGIKNCTNYECLNANLTNNDWYEDLNENGIRDEDELVYFPRYSQFASIIWATISPNVYFQATQYMYDSSMSEKLYHGHPAVGTDFFNIVNDVCLMGETIVTDFYDGYGNNEWDGESDDEESKNEPEIFADENGNGQYDEGEFFIDTGDDIGDIDSYYYEISTFSESYKNYYFYSRLLPNDPERSNLRDQNLNPVMGAFGSITTNKIDFKLIDCLDYLQDEDSCIDPTKTHGVCSWHPNVIIDDYEGSACLPVNWDL
jgi:hypothetical protein